MSASLVIEWIWNGKRQRLVRAGDNFLVERCDRDAPGVELWTTIHDTKGMRDAGVTRSLCGAIAELARRLADADEKRQALAETMTY